MSASITRSLSHTVDVSGTFESWDSTGTILTSVIVTAADTYDVTNGKLTGNNTLADVSYSVVNEAQGYFVTVAEATAPATLFVVDPNLRTAHLIADVQLTDLNDVTYTVHADYTWHAIDAVQTVISKTFNYEGGGVATLEKVTGFGDDATVTGKLVIPATTAFPALANATPEPSDQGQIQKVIDGTTTITFSPPKLTKLLQPFSGTTLLLESTDLLQKLTGM